MDVIIGRRNYGVAKKMLANIVNNRKFLETI